MCIPLAARTLQILAESGASQLEMDTALNVADHLFALAKRLGIYLDQEYYDEMRAENPEQF
jgi:hypothetical protein